MSEERQPHRAEGPVAVLGHDELRLPLGCRVLVVDLVAVDERDDVGVLLDRAALTQVRQLRSAVGAVLGSPRQLRQRDDRNLELLGEDLQTAAEL